ncbi:hypothetical protein HYX02_04605 [Candidatus Woesearchaeota archaeon]|nr:hypothetical protein [Candidatus Woesearchaeota archaeon]
MVKLIGMLLIVTSLLSLVAGAFIDFRYGSKESITGSAISNIIGQSPVALNLFDYIAGVAFSYSIVSLVMGIVFLRRD